MRLMLKHSCPSLFALAQERAYVLIVPDVSAESYSLEPLVCV